MTAVSAARPTQTPAMSDAPGNAYTIQYGDTLSGIAQRFGVSLSALEAANPQIGNPNLIYPGERLTIPGGGSGGSSAVQGTSSGHGEPASGMSISENGVKMIEGFEGFSATAYPDPGTGGAPWTIGYGHTGGVVPGETITQAQAETYLKKDLDSAESAVRENVHVPLTQNQFDALVSLTYNVGPNGYPSLLATLNRGDYAGAQKMFGDYIYAGGHVLQGLVNRRAQEAALFGSSAPSGVSSSPSPAPAPAPAPGGSHGGIYTVQAGDTLSAIAQRQGVSLAALEAANPQLSNPNYIYPGETIHLPAGIVVGKAGTAVAREADLLTALSPDGGTLRKVVSRQTALAQVERWRHQGVRVGFTNGCFDLLHPGQVHLLEAARDACDRLVVGLNDDASTRRLKGPTRPIQPDAVRAAVLAGLPSVDLVTVFDTDTPEALIRDLRPDVLVKGADYALADVVGADQVESWGGRVLLVPLLPVAAPLPNGANGRSPA
jgi:rfaE bifunctional protein nucleotidyltransferase chain/domain